MDGARCVWACRQDEELKWSVVYTALPITIRNRPVHILPLLCLAETNKQTNLESLFGLMMSPVLDEVEGWPSRIGLPRCKHCCESSNYWRSGGLAVDR